MKANTAQTPLSRLLTACGLFIALPFTLLLTAILALRALCYIHPPFVHMETPYYVVCFFVGIVIMCFSIQSFSHIFED